MSLILSLKWINHCKGTDISCQAVGALKVDDGSLLIALPRVRFNRLCGWGYHWRLPSPNEVKTALQLMLISTAYAQNSFKWLWQTMFAAGLFVACVNVVKYSSIYWDLVAYVKRSVRIMLPIPFSALPLYRLINVKMFTKSLFGQKSTPVNWLLLNY